MRAIIFDLDGTLVDTVYAHVFAWQQALAEAGMVIEGWLIVRLRKGLAIPPIGKHQVKGARALRLGT